MSKSSVLRNSWVLVLVILSACSTVKVRVLSEDGRTGTYRLLFLTNEQRDEFEQLKQKDPDRDHWVNYGGNTTEDLFRKVDKRHFTGLIGEANVDSIPTRGKNGISNAKYVLVILTGGDQQLSPSNHLLARRKELVRWPYWSDGTITVTKEHVRIGAPKPQQEEGSK